MVWTWRFEKADGTEAVPMVPPRGVSTQGDARSWIGAERKPLLDGGVDQVRLFRDDTESTARCRYTPLSNRDRCGTASLFPSTSLTI
jgi:hypothetical protein